MGPQQPSQPTTTQQIQPSVPSPGQKQGVNKIVLVAAIAGGLILVFGLVLAFLLLGKKENISDAEITEKQSLYLDERLNFSMLGFSLDANPTPDGLGKNLENLERLVSDLATSTVSSQATLSKNPAKDFSEDLDNIENAMRELDKVEVLNNRQFFDKHKKLVEDYDELREKAESFQKSNSVERLLDVGKACDGVLTTHSVANTSRAESCKKSFSGLSDSSSQATKDFAQKANGILTDLIEVSKPTTDINKMIEAQANSMMKTLELREASLDYAKELKKDLKIVQLAKSINDLDRSNQEVLSKYFGINELTQKVKDAPSTSPSAADKETAHKLINDTKEDLDSYSKALGGVAFSASIGSVGSMNKWEYLEKGRALSKMARELSDNKAILGDAKAKEAYIDFVEAMRSKQAAMGDVIKYMNIKLEADDICGNPYAISDKSLDEEMKNFDSHIAPCLSKIEEFKGTSFKPISEYASDIDRYLKSDKEMIRSAITAKNRFEKQQILLNRLDKSGAAFVTISQTNYMENLRTSLDATELKQAWQKLATSVE